MPSAASRGMVHCTTTSDIESVRNLLYPGKTLNSSSVSHIRLLPHDITRASTEAATIHQRIRLGSTIRANTASIITAAPK